MKTKFNQKVLSAVLTIAAIAAGYTTVWADDGGSCGRSNVNSGNNVKWQYTESTGTLRIYPNTTDPSGDNFQTAQYTTWNHAPWWDYRANITTVVIENGIQSIDNYFLDGCTALTSDNITIPASVTRIGSWVFRGCTGLTTAPIGSGVTNIAGNAFYQCTGLISATIPASVNDLIRNAFDRCTSLTTITVAAENTTYKDEDGVLMSKDGTNLIKYPEGKTATGYTIPDGVTTLGDAAFENNTHLTTVTIPDDVTSIGSCTFSNCIGLTSVTIPTSVTTIEDMAFSLCPMLTSVYLMSATPPTLEEPYEQFIDVNANCNFYHYGTAYNNNDDWTAMWNRMVNDPYVPEPDWTWTGTHTVIGTITLPDGVTAATAVHTYGGADYFASGSTVTLNYNAPAGYTLNYYTVNGIAIEGDSFEMPAENVTVTVELTAINYAINVSGDFEHGSVVADKETATIGETVTLTVTPDNGYELETLTVTTVDATSDAPIRANVDLTDGEDGTFTFDMPAAPVTVNATFKESTSTGIEEINASVKRGQRYNLMGQPVGKDYKGIVIEDGRKIIVR